MVWKTNGYVFRYNLNIIRMELTKLPKIPVTNYNQGHPGDKNSIMEMINMTPVLNQCLQ